MHLTTTTFAKPRGNFRSSPHVAFRGSVEERFTQFGFGNGLISNDVKVVADEETVKADQMHEVGLGERQGFPYQASHTLPESVIEAFDVGR